MEMELSSNDCDNAEIDDSVPDIALLFSSYTAQNSLNGESSIQDNANDEEGEYGQEVGKRQKSSAEYGNSTPSFVTEHFQGNSALREAGEKLLQSIADIDMIKKKAAEIAVALEPYKDGSFSNGINNDDEASVNNVELPEELKPIHAQTLFITQKLEEDRCLVDKSMKRKEQSEKIVRDASHLALKLYPQTKRINNDVPGAMAPEEHIDILQEKVMELQETIEKQKGDLSSRFIDIIKLQNDLTERQLSHLYTLEESNDLMGRKDKTIAELDRSVQYYCEELHIMRKYYAQLENEFLHCKNKLLLFQECEMAGNNMGQSVFGNEKLKTACNQFNNAMVEGHREFRVIGYLIQGLNNLIGNLEHPSSNKEAPMNLILKMSNRLNDLYMKYEYKNEHRREGLKQSFKEEIGIELKDRVDFYNQLLLDEVGDLGDYNAILQATDKSDAANGNNTQNIALVFKNEELNKLVSETGRRYSKLKYKLNQRVKLLKQENKKLHAWLKFKNLEAKQYANFPQLIKEGNMHYSYSYSSITNSDGELSDETDSENCYSDKLNALEIQHGELKLKYDSFLQQLEDYRANLIKSNTEVNNLSNQLEEVSKESDKLRNALVIAEQENNRLVTENCQLILDKNNESQEQLQLLLCENAKLKIVYEETEQVKNKLQAENQYLESDNEMYRNLLSQLSSLMSDIHRIQLFSDEMDQLSTLLQEENFRSKHFNTESDTGRNRISPFLRQFQRENLQFQTAFQNVKSQFEISVRTYHKHLKDFNTRQEKLIEGDLLKMDDALLPGSEIQHTELSNNSEYIRIKYELEQAEMKLADMTIKYHEALCRDEISIRLSDVYQKLSRMHLTINNLSLMCRNIEPPNCKQLPVPSKEVKEAIIIQQITIISNVLESKLNTLQNDLHDLCMAHYSGCVSARQADTVSSDLPVCEKQAKACKVKNAINILKRKLQAEVKLNEDLTRQLSVANEALSKLTEESRLIESINMELDHTVGIMTKLEGVKVMLNSASESVGLINASEGGITNAACENITTMSDLADEVHDVVKRFETFEEESNDILKENAEIKSALISKNKELIELCDKCHILKQTTSEDIHNLKSQLTLESVEKNVLLKENEEIKKALELKNIELAELRNKCTMSLVTTSDDIYKLQSEITGLTQELLQTTNYVNHLLAEHEKMKAALECKIMEFLKLQNKNATLEQTTSNDKQKLQRKITELMDQLVEISKNENRSLKENVEKKMMLEFKNEELLKLQDELATLKKTKSDDIHKLERELEELKLEASDYVNCLLKDNAEIKAAFESRNKDMLEFNDKYELLKQTMSCDIDKLACEIADLKQQLERTSDEKCIIKRQCDVLHDENSIYTSIFKQIKEFFTFVKDNINMAGLEIKPDTICLINENNSLKLRIDTLEIVLSEDNNEDYERLHLELDDVLRKNELLLSDFSSLEGKRNCLMKNKCLNLEAEVERLTFKYKEATDKIKILLRECLKLEQRNDSLLHRLCSFNSDIESFLYFLSRNGTVTIAGEQTIRNLNIELNDTTFILSLDTGYDTKSVCVNVLHTDCHECKNQSRTFNERKRAARTSILIEISDDSESDAENDLHVVDDDPTNNMESSRCNGANNSVETAGDLIDNGELSQLNVANNLNEVINQLTDNEESSQFSVTNNLQLESDSWVDGINEFTREPVLPEVIEDQGWNNEVGTDDWYEEIIEPTEQIQLADWNNEVGTDGWYEEIPVPREEMQLAEVIEEHGFSNDMITGTTVTEEIKVSEITENYSSQGENEGLNVEVTESSMGSQITDDHGHGIEDENESWDDAVTEPRSMESELTEITENPAGISGTSGNYFQQFMSNQIISNTSNLPNILQSLNTTQTDNANFQNIDLSESRSDCSQIGTDEFDNDNPEEQLNWLRELLSQSNNKIERLSRELLEAKKSQSIKLYDKLKTKLNLTLAELHLRDTRCNELERELSRLLSERDALQLRLSEVIRENERYRSQFSEHDSFTENTELQQKFDDLRDIDHMRDPQVSEESILRHEVQMHLLNDEDRSDDDISDINEPEEEERSIFGSVVPFFRWLSGNEQ